MKQPIKKVKKKQKKGFLDFMNASETRAEQISAKLWKIVERNKRQN